MTDEHVEKHREELTGEYIYGDMLQLVFFFLFLAVWISDAFFLHYTDISQLLPSWIRLPLGLLILVVSFYIAKTGLTIVFGKPHAEPHVIDYSVFKWVRHPIYLSAIMLYFGLLWIKISLSATGIWFLIICLYYVLSRFEEKLLLKRFGNDYKTYMEQVPMLFPRLI